MTVVPPRNDAKRRIRKAAEQMAEKRSGKTDVAKNIQGLALACALCHCERSEAVYYGLALRHCEARSNPENKNGPSTGSGTLAIQRFGAADDVD